MNTWVRLFAVTTAIVTLTACAAGGAFVRPDLQLFELGRTTPKNILDVMGAPKSEKTETRNEKQVHVMVYGHADPKLGETKVAAAIPAHTQKFYFVGGRLVGHEYNSTLKADCTDFDGEKAKEIVKGKSTRREVGEILGKPSGEYINPMIVSPEGSADMFLYTHIKDGVLSGGYKNYRKTLLVTYSADGVVLETEYSETGVY